jgi:hypothetical protein
VDPGRHRCSRIAFSVAELIQSEGDVDSEIGGVEEMGKYKSRGRRVTPDAWPAPIIAAVMTGICKFQTLIALQDSRDDKKERACWPPNRNRESEGRDHMKKS